MISKFNIEALIFREIRSPPFHEEIMELIHQNKALVVYNALVKNGAIGVC